MQLGRSSLRSLLSIGCRTFSVLMLVLCVAAPAAAKDYLLESPDGLLAFETEQDRQDYIEWVKNGSRSAWRYVAEKLLRPCGQGLNEDCQKNMVKLRNDHADDLKMARLVVTALVNAKDRFQSALRNGNFLYAAAPSYQLLQAIVGTPGNCASWSAAANQRLGVQ